MMQCLYIFIILGQYMIYCFYYQLNLFFCFCKMFHRKLLVTRKSRLGLCEFMFSCACFGLPMCPKVPWPASLAIRPQVAAPVVSVAAFRRLFEGWSRIFGVKGELMLGSINWEFGTSRWVHDAALAKPSFR